MKYAEKTYSFEQLTNLIGQDVNLKPGPYHCNLNIKGSDENPTYTFIFTDPESDANVATGEGVKNG